MTRLLSLLRSPRLALTVIGFLASWAAIGAWAPWMRVGGGEAPRWAHAVGLAHPFTSWPFLTSVALLFVATLACTWGRRGRILALRRGELPPFALRLAARDADIRAFLRAEGFRGEGDLLLRSGFALWGGWVLHVGLLLLIAAIFVQQGFADSGAFDLAEGEAARLDAPGVVFARERAPLAREPLPAIEVRLERFDPHVRQRGYAPDRLSRLWVGAPGEEPRVETIDRAAGVRLGGVEIFQAIPTGLSLTVDVPGMGLRAIRLASETSRRSASTVVDPAGVVTRFVVDSERDLDDPEGAGRLLAWVERAGMRAAVAPGVPFAFGAGEAHAIGVSRWGRFTWTRTPGLGAVFAAFAVILTGCALLAFPAGVARLGRPGEEAAAVLFTVRGAEAIAAEWGGGADRGKVG